MGLDIYVGTLSRYYSGDWETILQRTAREQGMQLMTIRVNEDTSNAVTDQAEAREIVTRWKLQLNRLFEDHSIGTVAWDELADAPYESDKPDFLGYGALVMWAAYVEHPELRRPARNSEEWTSDEAVRRSIAPGFQTSFPQLVHGVELWLPGSFEAVLQIEAPSGEPKVIGCCSALVDELRELNERSWNASASQISQWRFNGIGPDAELEPAARFGFSVMYELAQFAVQNHLPILLDY